MSVLSYPFHSLLFKLSNKEMNFPFSPLKLLNKRRKEYFKIILYIPFHSLFLNKGLEINNTWIVTSLLSLLVSTQLNAN